MKLEIRKTLNLDVNLGILPPKISPCGAINTKESDKQNMEILNATTVVRRKAFFTQT